ncbi:MAG: hypothetical protein ACTSX7_00150 [Alphaproteobacteria bacterium]
MRIVLMAISLASLGILFAGPVLHAAGIAPPEVGQYGIFAGTAGWFVTSPFWMKR